MNYTLTQAIDRAKDLSGIIKAARAHEADCAADHEAKKNIAEIAGEAHQKAISACVELEQEREALADHIAALVRKVGDPLELPEPTTSFWQGDDPDSLAQRLMARSEEKLNGAFNEATS